MSNIPKFKLCQLGWFVFNSFFYPSQNLTISVYIICDLFSQFFVFWKIYTFPTHSNNKHKWFVHFSLFLNILLNEKLENLYKMLTTVHSGHHERAFGVDDIDHRPPHLASSFIKLFLGNYVKCGKCSAIIY